LFLVLDSLVRPRGGQDDQLLDEVVDDELDGHHHAHVQQARALRGERVGGKEGVEGREGCAVVVEVAIREIGGQRYGRSADTEKFGSGMTNNTHTYTRQHYIAGKKQRFCNNIGSCTLPK